MSRSPLPNRVHSPACAAAPHIDPSLIGGGLLGLALLGIFIFWWLGRPTPQERVVRDFFVHTQQGHYDEAITYLDGPGFTELAQRSKIRGLPGPIKDVPLASIIASEEQIRVYLSAAPFWSSAVHFEEVRTQRDRDRTRKLVHFELTSAVNANQTMPFTRPEVSYPFTMEGVATVIRKGKGWVIEGLDFTLRPQNPKDLPAIIQVFGGMPPSEGAPRPETAPPDGLE